MIVCVVELAVDTWISRGDFVSFHIFIIMLCMVSVTIILFNKCYVHRRVNQIRLEPM